MDAIEDKDNENKRLLKKYDELFLSKHIVI